MALAKCSSVAAQASQSAGPVLSLDSLPNEVVTAIVEELLPDPERELPAQQFLLAVLRLNRSFHRLVMPVFMRDITITASMRSQLPVLAHTLERKPDLVRLIESLDVCISRDRAVDQELDRRLRQTSYNAFLGILDRCSPTLQQLHIDFDPSLWSIGPNKAALLLRLSKTIALSRLRFAPAMLGMQLASEVIMALPATMEAVTLACAESRAESEDEDGSDLASLVSLMPPLFVLPRLTSLHMSCPLRLGELAVILRHLPALRDLSIGLDEQWDAARLRTELAPVAGQLEHLGLRMLWDQWHARPWTLDESLADCRNLEALVVLPGMLSADTLSNLTRHKLQTLAIFDRHDAFRVPGAPATLLRLASLIQSHRFDKLGALIIQRSDPDQAERVLAAAQEPSQEALDSLAQLEEACDLTGILFYYGCEHDFSIEQGAATGV